MAGSFLLTFSRDAPGSPSFAAAAQDQNVGFTELVACVRGDLCRMYPEDDLNTLHRDTDRQTPGGQGVSVGSIGSVESTAFAVPCLYLKHPGEKKKRKKDTISTQPSCRQLSGTFTVAPSVVFCGRSSFLEQQGVASVVEELPTQVQLCAVHTQVRACGWPSRWSGSLTH